MSSVLIMSLLNQLGITSDQLVATMVDHASINNVATQTLQIVYQRILDVGCFPTPLTVLETHILDEFVKGWIRLFTHSPKTNWLGRRVQVCQSLHTQPLDGGQNGRS